MNRTAKYIFTVSLSLFMLTGCKSEETQPAMTENHESPLFTATIADETTRAFDTTWETGDEIAISGANRTNVCYITKEGDGLFEVQKSDDQIYFQNNDEVVFTAFYPWSEIQDGVETISVDTRNQSQQKEFDFLWAEATGKKEAPRVSFNFAHSMVKLAITIKPGYSMSFDEMRNALFSLSGFSHTGSFNVTDGTTTVGNIGTTWDFSQYATFNDADQTATYSFILFPQLLADKLKFTANLYGADNTNLSLQAEVDFSSVNREKDGEAARNEWVSGRQYNMTFTLNKTDIILDRCVINPWNVVSGDDIIVD